MERQPLVTLVLRELTGLRGGTVLMCRPGCKVQQLHPDELPPRAPEALALGGEGRGGAGLHTQNSTQDEDGLEPGYSSIKNASGQQERENSPDPETGLERGRERRDDLDGTRRQESQTEGANGRQGKEMWGSQGRGEVARGQGQVLCSELRKEGQKVRRTR